MNSFKKTGYHSFLGTNGSEQEGARAQCGSYRRISMYASRSRLEPVLDSARIYLSIYPRRPALRAVVWSCARTRIEGSCQRSPDRTLVAFRVVLHRRRASKLIRRPRALAIEATEPAPSSARTAYIVRFDGALRRRPLPSVHPWIHNNNSAHPDPSELSAAR